MATRPRVLLNAFAFSPFRGSEAAVGWKIACRLCRDVDLVVLYGDVRGDRRTQLEVGRYAKTAGLPEGLEAVYVAPTPAMAFLEKWHAFPGSWMLYYRAYRRWQLMALETAEERHRVCPFNVVHQLTYIGYREPSDLWKMGVPFVWGPVSGAENIPWQFYRRFRPAEVFRPLSRDLGNRFQARFPGRIRTAARAAAKVFAVSSAEECLFRSWGVSVERMLETGTTPSPNARVRSRPHRCLKIVWSGLFTPRKAFPILIEALVSLSDSKLDWSLVVIGDGPMESVWKTAYSSSGLPLGRVHWTGRLSHEAAVECMADGDVLVHTGLREGTPHVVLEALSLGMPVVCHDAGGMGTAVTEESGIRIPLKSFEESVRHLSIALRRLMSEENLLVRLSEGALCRASELSWDAIAARFLRAYREIARGG